jgi:hypothetical protein
LVRRQEPQLFQRLTGVSYGGLQSPTVLGGANDQFTVQSTAAGTPLTVKTGAGTNSVFIGNGSGHLHTLGGIASPINVVQRSGGGSTSLIIDDSADTSRGLSLSSSRSRSCDYRRSATPASPRWRSSKGA